MERSNSLQKQPPSSWGSRECQSFDLYLQASGLPASALMEQASKQITDFLLSAEPTARIRSVAFLCGPGNNGADAIAAARQLLCHPHITPLIYLPGGPPSPESLLSLQYEAYKNLGGIEVDDLKLALNGSSATPSILVDGLFGVGLRRPVSGNYAEALLVAQKSGIRTLAVDCPSGLDCDTGAAMGATLPAKWTISFIGPKRGFECDQGPRLCGEVQIADIGVRRELANRWLEQHRSSSQPAKT